jgi:hypothetical protein
MANESVFAKVAADGTRPPRRSPAPQMAVVLTTLVALIGISVFVGCMDEKKDAAAGKPAAGPSTTSANGSPTGAPGASGTPATSPATPTETSSGASATAQIDELKTQIGELTAHLKSLEEKLASLPKAEPAPDLKPLEAKVDDLVKPVGMVPALTEKLDKLDERITGLETAMKSAKADFEKLANEKPASAPAPTPAAESQAKLADGMDLFKEGKYKEAGEVFKKLETLTPEDARVFYYEAFVNGLTSNDWKGETLTLAAQGAALEKAGNTKKADVDAAFTDLPANLKPWLAYFRAQKK